ncbi:hypothetical protein FGIG_08788 [Fasciola gigantica]|uniref:Uncharacterized protein n=1 Tax=Fasciola gigantica TaxID=46835 RepID=A0A504YTM5_FASGI|nr:hypothetical protein FGIG_08788 [Fasciola gigantica]
MTFTSHEHLRTVKRNSTISLLSSVLGFGYCCVDSVTVAGKAKHVISVRSIRDVYMEHVEEIRQLLWLFHSLATALPDGEACNAISHVCNCDSNYCGTNCQLNGSSNCQHVMKNDAIQSDLLLTNCTENSCLNGKFYREFLDSVSV